MHIRAEIWGIMLLAAMALCIQGCLLGRIFGEPTGEKTVFCSFTVKNDAGQKLWLQAFGQPEVEGWYEIEKDSCRSIGRRVFSNQQPFDEGIAAYDSVLLYDREYLLLKAWRKNNAGKESKFFQAVFWKDSLWSDEYYDHQSFELKILPQDLQ